MNELLHALTNRAGDFLTPVFPVKDDFRPRQLSSEEQGVRDFLKISDHRSDFWPVFMLRVASMYDDLKVNSGETQKSYDLGSFVPPRYTTSGATLVSHQGRGPGIFRVAQEWPALDTVKLVVLDGSASQVQHGTAVYTANSSIRGDLLVVDWPASTCVVGALRSMSGWTSGQSAELQCYPLAVNYQAVREACLLNQDCMMVLQRASLTGAFVSAAQPQRALAILLNALVVLNPVS